MFKYVLNNTLQKQYKTEISLSFEHNRLKNTTRFTKHEKENEQNVKSVSFIIRPHTKPCFYGVNL